MAQTHFQKQKTTAFRLWFLQRVEKLLVIPRERSDRGNPHFQSCGFPENQDEIGMFWRADCHASVRTGSQ